MAKKKAGKPSKTKPALVPPEVIEFLAEHVNQPFTFDLEKHPDMEVDVATFLAPKSLRRSKFALSTWEYYHNEGEKGEDPELIYNIEGIDLIRDCGDGYEPEGILVWFPMLGEFGFWDPDHLVIGFFPKTNWATIAKKLPQYVNAQWNETPKRKLLRPWADERCAGIKPKRG